MVDIFSSFDPYINYSFQLSSLFFWFLILFSILMIRRSFWIGFNQLYWVISFPLDIINTQSLRTISHNIKGFTGIVVVLFLILICINLMGLLPYRFGYSRHIVYRLMFGLPLWFSLIQHSHDSSQNHILDDSLESLRRLDKPLGNVRYSEDPWGALRGLEKAWGTLTIL